MKETVNSEDGPNMEGNTLILNDDDENLNENDLQRCTRSQRRNSLRLAMSTSENNAELVSFDGNDMNAAEVSQSEPVTGPDVRLINWHSDFFDEVGDEEETESDFDDSCTEESNGTKPPEAKEKRKNKPRHKFPCKVCGRLYTKFYLEAHMRLHTGEKPFCCQQCRRQFATEYYLRMHTERCHGKPRAYRCDVCERTLASKRGLIEHKRIHSEERPFQCQLCGKGFRQPALLFNHIKTHNDLLPFQCELCGNQYKYKRSMERHKEKIHDGVLHSFPCSLCDRVFSTKSKLKEHQYFHEGNSPHVCQICGKRLLARKTLQNHMLIHRGEKPFECEYCHKKFRFVIVLKRHLSVHTGVKPFHCSKCGRQFIHRVYLDRHKCTGTNVAKNPLPVVAGIDDTLADVANLPCESNVTSLDLLVPYPQV